MAPSMLELVQLSPRLFFPPGGEDLYRHMAVLSDLRAGTEVLDVACSRGVALEYFVREFEVQGSGVEADAQLVSEISERCRRQSLADRLQVQVGRADRLPYRDGIFDVAIGELGFSSDVDPSAAVAELARVTRSGGTIMLVQLVWLAPVELERREWLGQVLGVQPRMLVEWKRMLLEAGIGDLHTEDWSDTSTTFGRVAGKPFPDFAELFSLPEKIGILRHVFRRWGWSGVGRAWRGNRAVHRVLTRERILGLDLIKGTKLPQTEASFDD